MFNWQNVGRQNRLFGIGKGKCPAGCGHDEDYLHYLKCEAVGMKESRTELQFNLKRHLDKQDTYAGITSTVMRILRKGILHTLQEFPHITSQSDKFIQEALTEQLALGEGSLEMGYISTKWKQAQDAHIQQEDKSYYTDRWSVQFTKALLNYTYNVWKRRNEYTHGNTIKESYEAKRAQLRQQVQELYAQDRSSLNGKDLSYFKLPLQLRQKSGIEGMKLWIEMVQIAFKNAQKEKQMRITSWLHQNVQEQQHTDGSNINMR